MTRLAIVVPTLDRIGGAESQALALALGLARRNWQVTIITLEGTAAALQPVFQSAGIAHLSLHMRRAWVDPRGWASFLRWQSVHKPEILHAHLPHAAWFTRTVRLLAPTPVVLDSYHSAHTGSRLRPLLYRLTSPCSNATTTVSLAAAQSLLAAGLASPRKLHVLPNGITIPPAPGQRRAGSAQASSADASPGETSAPGIRFHWVAVGRLAPVKDHPTLLRAFARLPDQARLTLAGTGADLPQLEQLAANLGIRSRVTFAGFVHDIPALLATADGFVLSSRWEGLPVALLEAAASSVPAVVTHTPGTREAVLPGETAFLAPIAQPEALATAMLRLMEMPPESRQAMGERARAFAQEHYSLTTILDRWEMLYRELLARSPTPTRLA